ncbi:guanylate kinase [Thermodesulfobacteriota bacterium]
MTYMHFGAEKRGILFIISAPSGAGKTTLFKMALEKIDGLSPSISCTTRAKRGQEVDGKDYIFLDEKAFNHMVEESGFVEWAKVHNNFYGTPKKNIDESIEKGDDILFDIDIQGARSLKETFPEAVLIFIMPPSFSTLKERLVQRTAADDPLDIELRMLNAMDEIRAATEFDYIVTNDDLNTAFFGLNAVIVAERLKREKNNFDFDEFIGL